MLQNVRQIAQSLLANSVLQFRKLSQPLLFLEMKQLLEKSGRWRCRQSLCGSQTLADGWETSVMELAGRQQQLTELSSTNSVTLLHFPPPAGSLHRVEPTLCWTSTTDPGPATRVATDLPRVCSHPDYPALQMVPASTQPMLLHNLQMLLQRAKSLQQGLQPHLHLDNIHCLVHCTTCYFFFFVKP